MVLLDTLKPKLNMRWIKLFSNIFGFAVTTHIPGVTEVVPSLVDEQMNLVFTLALMLRKLEKQFSTLIRTMPQTLMDFGCVF